MAIFSTLRSRRTNNNKNKTVEQMIAFQLGKEWFALPILAIYKVIPLGKIYGDPQNTGVSLTSYEELELPVIDVAKQIFACATSTLETTNNQENSPLDRNLSLLEKKRYLLILHYISSKSQDNISNNEVGNYIGLPIDSQPTMYRVETSAFKPLPETYLNKGNIKCISSQIIELSNVPPLFVLEPQKLLQSMSFKDSVFE